MTDSPHSQSPPAKAKDGPRVTLRVLATTDLHCHILPWDDLRDQPAPDRGLAQIASLIATARAEVPGSLLLDNGDFLTGSPLADHIAHRANKGRQRRADPHPMIAAMNQLGYDAATLGNHEFSEGLALLRQALAQAQFPIVATNLDRLGGPSGKARRPFMARQALIRRMLADQNGRLHPVTVGLLGFLPPQTMRWERHNLAGRLDARCILASAHAALPRLRRAGADLVIALSHSGLSAGAAANRQDDPDDENISDLLASLNGIDAVIAGHTHQLFPNPEAGTAQAPAPRGALGGAPILMPGFFGSHLGVLDLDLCQTPTGWQVDRARASLRPVARRSGAEGRLRALVRPDPVLAALVAPAVTAMRAAASQPIGSTETALHSYFALIGWSPVQDLLAEAQAANMRRLLVGRVEADWPLLVAVAPFKAGGRGGPMNYTDIPPGPLTTRHVADLYIHPNSPVALRMTGADLARWLERSVSLFHSIAPGSRDANLVDPAFPSYNFDMIHGLSFAIDLSQPARYDHFGHLVAPTACRIRDLRHRGQPVQPADRFVLATNSYRAGGGAGFAGTHPTDVLIEESRPIRQVLHDHIRTADARPGALVSDWRFAPMPGTSVILDSGQGAAAHLAQRPASLSGLTAIGLQPSGFLRFRLPL